MKFQQMGGAARRHDTPRRRAHAKWNEPSVSRTFTFAENFKAEFTSVSNTQTEREIERERERERERVEKRSGGEEGSKWLD